MRLNSFCVCTFCVCTISCFNTDTWQYYNIDLKFCFKTIVYSFFTFSNFFREGWGSYSLFPEQINSPSKMWGTLESFHLTKVAITAKCSYCKAVAYKNICSNICSAPKQFTTSAYAMWVNIVDWGLDWNYSALPIICGIWWYNKQIQWIIYVLAKNEECLIHSYIKTKWFTWKNNIMPFIYILT